MYVYCRMSTFGNSNFKRNKNNLNDQELRNNIKL